MARIAMQQIECALGQSRGNTGVGKSEWAAIAPAMAIVTQMTIILRMPPTPALFTPPKA